MRTALLFLAALATSASAQVFVSSGANSGLRLYDRSGAGTDIWLDPTGGRLDIMANSVVVASITTSGVLYANTVVATGNTPLTVNSTTKVTNLNADLLDGLDSTAFGDATAANQTTILGRIGTNADAAGTSTLFAHMARLYGQVDNAYSACYMAWNNGDCGDAPACIGGWTQITTLSNNFSFVSQNNCGTSIVIWRACCLAR